MLLFLIGLGLGFAVGFVFAELDILELDIFAPRDYTIDAPARDDEPGAEAVLSDPRARDADVARAVARHVARRRS